MKQACTFISNFELALATMVRDRGLDGVICGHIRVPVLEYRHGVLYANCGDWVEHATAIVEDAEGRLELRSLLGGGTVVEAAGRQGGMAAGHRLEA